MVAGTTSICSDVCEQFGSVWPSRVWPNLDDLTAQAILFELTSEGPGVPNVPRQWRQGNTW